MTFVGSGVETEAVKTTPAASSRISDPLAEGLALLCQLNNRDVPVRTLTAGLPLVDGKLTLELVPRAARRAGLQAQWGQSTLGGIAEELLPALLSLDDGSFCALIAVEGEHYTCIRPELSGKQIVFPRKTLLQRFSGTVVYAGERDVVDRRADDIAADTTGHWFWSHVKANAGAFGEVGVAAAIANILATVTALFAMQVYDRVIPNFAFATLWALAIGVCIAILFEAILRNVRSHIMNKIGRRIDQRISADVFEQAMNIQCAARPRSTGSFVNQVREVEAVREFFTSSTIGAVSDLPFVLLFLFVIWLIAGPLVVVLAVAIPLIIGAGLLAQYPLSKLSKKHHKEASIRNGILMEAVSNPETVKAYQGEAGFQRLWEEYTQLLAQNSLKQRGLGSGLTYFTTSLQQLSYVFVVVAGVYLVEAGSISVGALLGSSILTSRTIAPLAQLSVIFSRWQQMRTALGGLTKIMKLPVDRPRDRQFVSRPRLAGSFDLRELKFAYGKDEPAAVAAPAVSIAAGEAVALLGNNGAGKSTMLKLMAGLYHPTGGQMLLDGTDIGQIDPADLRRQIGYLPQEVVLFFGTLRSNLAFGLGPADDSELIEALEFAGAADLVRNHPKGLDRPVGESGRGLSGGQRQSVGLARLWLRDPAIVLMDEPTAAMDQSTEAKAIENMRRWIGGRTLVVATHRQPILKLVSKALVMKSGRVVAFGAREEILERFAAGSAGAAS